jgi:ubiquinone/menaquinone biosynthesis C-methylase UbiE
MNNKRKQKIKKAYDIASKEYANKCFFELYEKPLDRKLYDLFFERTVNKGLVLEIGCGPGEIANYLKMKGMEVIGIDISDKMIEQAKKLNPFIDFRVGDVFHLDIKDKSVAGVAAPYLIVNFEWNDLTRAFKEIHRVLIKQGLFFLSFHAGKEEIEIKDFFVKGNTIPYTFFDSDEVVGILVKSGFRIIEYMNRMPYEGEVTKRTFVFAEKK